MPHYSTDIAAAWELVEKLNTAPFLCDFYLDRNADWEDGEPGSWCAEFGPDLHHKAFARTAPLAICLAALKAVQADAFPKTSHDRAD